MKSLLTMTAILAAGFTSVSICNADFDMSTLRQLSDGRWTVLITNGPNNRDLDAVRLQGGIIMSGGRVIDNGKKQEIKGYPVVTFLGESRDASGNLIEAVAVIIDYPIQSDGIRDLTTGRIRWLESVGNFSGRWKAPGHGTMVVTQTGNRLSTSGYGKPGESWASLKGLSGWGTVQGNTATIYSSDANGTRWTNVLTLSADGRSFTATYRNEITGGGGRWHGHR